MSNVSVVIPHVPIPEREKTLARAVRSVQLQTDEVAEILVCPDEKHEGPGRTRTRGLLAASSEWIVYLDDDDFLDSDYVQKLLATATETNADVVYPWFRVQGGGDPFPMFYQRPWSNDDPHIFPITYLVKREVALEAGGFPSAGEMGDMWAPHWNGLQGGEDWAAILRLIEIGAKIVHHPERLWTWSHEGVHFSGKTW